MEQLIYDRTRIDVETALNNPGSSIHLKGSYNFTDLNRVESWCEYLTNVLRTYGFSENLVIKTNWNIRDYPTQTHIDRIRDNISTLKEYCFALINNETIIYNNTLNYIQANTLEHILYEIDRYVQDIKRKQDMQFNAGVATVKRKYITSKVDIETEGSKKIQNLNKTVGVFLVQRKYIKMKGV